MARGVRKHPFAYYPGSIMKRAVFLSTFLLAAVLSPIVFYGYTCAPPADARLAVLQLRAGDFYRPNLIEGFDPNVFSYEARFPESESAGVLWVRAKHPSMSIEVEYDGMPVELVWRSIAELDVPLGQSELAIHVATRGPMPDSQTYVVSIHRGDLCEGVICDDQNECTDDVCNPASDMCEYTPVEDGSPCAEGTGGCYGGACNLGYFVSPSGDDGNPGTHEAPFRTINRAAQVAQPGDTITVQSGVYREWVRPARGGVSEDTRITYRAAPGADVRILGSEPATGWVQTSDKVWAIELDESRFAGFNPFNTLTRHPECVMTETGDCWGWLFYGRWTHLGDVYIDGVGLTEKQTMGEIEHSPLSWRTQTVGGTTTIWANFGERDPNEAAVELNHRPFAFFPEQAGLGYITVKGFVIQNVATHWAPPNVFQPGAIGPNAGHHWVIEDNIVMYSKAVCISIGIPNGQADANASGYHVIRNNVVMRCGQSGITGHRWTKNSQIVGNHIEEINYRNEFGGAETAAIKHHLGSGLHIAGNFIRSVTAGHGIWADFFNYNWRVEGNVVLGAGVYSMMAEANHGPNLYVNNIFVGGGIGVYSSRADAWVHNLFINAPQTWVNQDYGGRLPVDDARWVNNVFIGDGLNSSLAPSDNRYNRNVFLDGAVPHSDDADAVIGNTPTEIQILETSQGVTLGFEVDEATLSAGYPLVDNETLELNFPIDATVDADYWGEQRSELSNSPGPFATLQPGRNEFTVYEYPPLYLKAQCFTGCDDSNDCTVDACNPAVGCEYSPAADGGACAESNECAVGRCTGGACALAPVPNGTPCTGGTCQAGVCTWYAQDFESLDQMSSTALSDDGWLVFGQVRDGSGALKFGYGPFPAPNGTPDFSSIVTGEGGPEQGAQQLVVYNDYNCCDPNQGHRNGTDRVQSSVFQQPLAANPIPAGDVGKTLEFTFDAKRGNIAGSSTALAFIQTLDPGFGQTNFVQIDMTNIPDTWATYSISLGPIDAGLVGQLLEFGFLSRASNFEPSSVFYDNIVVVLEAP